MKKIFYIILFFHAFTLSSKAQNTNDSIMPLAKNKILLNEAIKQMHDDGALLVRIHLRKSLMDKLEKYGDTKGRKEVIISEVIANNKLIISEFKRNYHCSKVYFFASEYSKDIKDGNFQKVMFLDENLAEYAPTFNFTHFLTAEYAETPNASLDALKLMDAQFEMIDYFTSFKKKKFYEKTIIKLEKYFNKKLKN